MKLENYERAGKIVTQINELTTLLTHIAGNELLKVTISYHGANILTVSTNDYSNRYRKEVSDFINAMQNNIESEILYLHKELETL